MKTIKIKIKNSLKSKMKDFIFNSTMVKADIIWGIISQYRTKNKRKGI